VYLVQIQFIAYNWCCQEDKERKYTGGEEMNLSDKAKAAQREYKRQWRERNREKIQAYNTHYWEKKAASKGVKEEGKKNESE